MEQNEAIANNLDLFGLPASPLPKARGADPKKRKPTKANGYAARPGTGPKGETCKTCRYSFQRCGGNRKYWKCKKLGRCTNGPGTDIRIKSPACRFWEAIPHDEQTSTKSPLASIRRPETTNQQSENRYATKPWQGSK